MIREVLILLSVLLLGKVIVYCTIFPFFFSLLLLLLFKFAFVCVLLPLYY